MALPFASAAATGLLASVSMFARMAQDFHGSDTFTYTVQDSSGATDTATVTVHLTTPAAYGFALKNGAVSGELTGTTFQIFGQPSLAANGRILFGATYRTPDRKTHRGIFFGANVLAGISALLAVPLANKIGLINTMVFTHIPSNILLMLVPLMPNLPLAIGLLLLRFSISQMDVPTRQSYTMAVVAPDERSAASGVTAIARSVGGSRTSRWSCRVPTVAWCAAVTAGRLLAYAQP